LVWWVRDELDVGRMKEAASLFEGMHDFRSFAAEDREEKSTKVLIQRVAIREVGDLILVRVEGSHFLWRMVRRIVGVVVEVGRGKLQPAEIRRFLTTRSAEPARLAAPSSGLFLERVYYRGDRRPADLEPVLPVATIAR
ncbi:MAG: tRNA pseudouridine(38-40) synthase TruA, partial [Acidobacteriota bacterium]